MKPLLDKKNVVGVAYGEKWVNGTPTGQPAVLVFVEKKEPLSSLDPDDVVESTYEGMQTDVVGKSGTFRALGAKILHSTMENEFSVKKLTRVNPSRPVYNKPRVRARLIAQAITAKAPVKVVPKITNVNPRTLYRPILGGLSVSHYRVTAGTIAMVFRDKDNDVVILSNNHVLANTNICKFGDPIYQPGTYDKKPSPTGLIGTLKDWVPLAEGINQDSAIAKVNVAYLAEINKIGKPTGFGTATMGMKLTKSGRTTNVTTGKVIALNGSFKVWYTDTKAYTITGCIVTQAMCDGGDSGSAVLDPSNRIVGLLFAGSRSMTLHNNISPIVARYGLKIA